MASVLAAIIARTVGRATRLGRLRAPDLRRPAHQIGQRRDLDPPRREAQDAEGGSLLAAGPEGDRVVADGRRNGSEEVPEARLVGGVVGPLGAAVDVDLLQVAGRVAERDVRVRGEVPRFERVASGQDPAGPSFPEGMEDARPRAPAAVDGGHVAPHDLADARQEVLLDVGKRGDSHATTRRFSSGPEPGEATRAAKASVECVGGGPLGLLCDLPDQVVVEVGPTAPEEIDGRAHQTPLLEGEGRVVPQRLDYLREAALGEALYAAG